MNIPPNLVPLFMVLAAATIAASNATFGGVKPDLRAQDLIPGQPANATNR